MQMPYARVGEIPLAYNGPPVADAPRGPARIGVFGPHAEQLTASLTGMMEAYGGRYRLVPIASDVPWGIASHELVKLIYDDQALGLIATGRNASHLAEQLAVKSFVPLIAVSADRGLTSINIPWVFRLPPETPIADALRCLLDAADKAGSNRGRMRETLASGELLGGKIKFNSSGEAQAR
jgi:branched-chain amino acid transport system substrate-binding protein